MLRGVTLYQKLRPLALTSLRDPRALTHSLFRFPGRFHPPLVTYLIGLHPDARTVGDPMVGCGTVAVEATFVGRDGFYSDIDPLCCLLTRAKTRTIDPNTLAEKVNAVLQKSGPFARPSAKRAEARKHIRDLEGSTPFRAPPNVFHWFQPYVVINLCNILQRLAEIERRSRQRMHSWRYSRLRFAGFRVQTLCHPADWKSLVSGDKLFVRVFDLMWVQSSGKGRR